jgi:predicted PurR-regulated permease PerM
VATNGTTGQQGSAGTPPARDITRTAAKAAVGVIVVVALAFGLWKVRDLIVLLLLALTFAAAMRPGVERFRGWGVPQSLAIAFFFITVLGILAVFIWVAVPPAIHQVGQALAQPGPSATEIRHSTGIRHDFLVWLDKTLRDLPSGSKIIHPVATYGGKATHGIVAFIFVLAATWYWIAERDRMIDLLVRVSPEAKRDKARRTLLEIDRRLGHYTRLKFIMIFVVGTVLAAGFYLVGLHYWLLLGGAVSVLEIIPVIGPLAGAILVLAVGLPQSVHVALLGLLVLVAVREFQSYVINPHLMGRSVGLSPMVTLVSVSVVGLIFGPFAVVLAVPVTSAVATLIDVFVLDHDPPPPKGQRRLSGRRRPAANQAQPEPQTQS